MNVTKRQSQRPRSAGFALFTVVTGIIGWFASFQLLTEYLKTLISPDYSPNCNVSVVVTCGPNMDSWQGSILGFSNTIIGVAAFVAPIVVGMALLAGARFASWFWGLYLVGLTGGLVLIHWLAYQSIFTLGTLCPWCMIVWAVMIPMWWTTLLYGGAKGFFGGSVAFQRNLKAVSQWNWLIIFVNIILIAAIAQFRLNWLFTEFGIKFFS